jgi:hypothetical protein
MEAHIKEILESKFEKELFESAIHNLNDVNNKLRYNNFAYSIRELSRHFLHRLSPDEHVKSCEWFKVITDNGKPTRTQRIKYAIQGGITDEMLKDLDFEVDELNEEIKSIKKTIDSLSRYTHINEDTFNLESSQVEKMSQKVFNELKTFVERVKSCKTDLTIFLDGKIEQHMIEEIIFNNYENVGALARRFSIDSSDVTNYHIIEINNDTIIVDISGDIHFALEYGSNKERREGDGLDINQSFPFQTKIRYEINKDFPSGNFEVDAFGVNTDSWYGEIDDDELDKMIDEEIEKEDNS